MDVYGLLIFLYRSQSYFLALQALVLPGVNFFGAVPKFKMPLLQSWWDQLFREQCVCLLSLLTHLFSNHDIGHLGVNEL